MKRKTLLTLLILTISATLLSGCKASDSVDNSAVKSEVTETTAVESEATEQTEQTETTEEVRNKMFGLDDIDNTSASETTMNTSQPYYPSSTPCGNTQKVQAWNNFCENWNESDYGTTTAGKCENDFPYYGDTGYDATLLEYRTTDKGYTVLYDTATGRVYYAGMILPTGDSWDERESGSAAVIGQYIIDNENIGNMYDITYAQFQELLGTYAGD